MSLAALADHMASKGRGGDSMLVHMAPEEVQALQALAERHGKTLTINPETGQPEALSLKSLLPVIAGVALGPAGFGLMSAGMAGLTVGGITALATGDISRGLMAGLGAYGGAGLGEALAGAGAASAEGAAGALGVEGAATGAGSQAAMLAEQNAGFGAEGLGKLAESAKVAAGAAPSTSGALSSGLSAITKSPEAFGQFAKDNWKTLAAATIPPMLASEGVQTTTPRPTDTGSIRKFSYDPYTQTYTPLGVFPAAGYKGMADGGIVALAEGGPDYSKFDPANYMGQGTVSTQAEVDAANAARAAALANAPGQWADGKAISSYLPGFNPNDLTTQQTLGELNWRTGGADTTSQNFAAVATPAQVAAADTAWMNRKAELEAQDRAAGLLGPGQTITPTGGVASLTSAMPQAGAATPTAQTGIGTLIPEGTSSATAWHMQRGLGFGPVDQSIDNWFAKYNPVLATMSPAEQEAAMRAALAKEGMNEADVVKATGMGIAGHIQSQNLRNVSAGSLPGGVGGGANTVVNPNGTITTGPNIPGMPQTGFTGMGQVRDVYTQGGGNLGYTSYAPKTIDEFYQHYGNTGGSQQAYDYLMGKGAADITKPFTKTGEIMRPYSESVMGTPVNLATKRFIFDPVTRTYKDNPDFKPLSYDSTGNRSVGASANEIKAAAATKGGAGFQQMVDAGSVTYEQIAAALGITVEDAKKKFPKTAAAAANTQTSNTKDISTVGGGGDSGSGAAAAAAAASGEGGGMGNSGEGGGGAGEGGWAYGGVTRRMALGGLGALAAGGPAVYNLGGYSDGGRLLRGPGDGVSDSIPATIGDKQPARLADGEFVVPARIVSELGNGSTEAGARKLYAMMDRVQRARGKTTGKGKVAKDTNADKYLPA